MAVYFAETVVEQRSEFEKRRLQLIDEYANSEHERKWLLDQMEMLKARFLAPERDGEEPRHLIKVGYSESPERRVKGLRDQYGQRLRIINVIPGGELVEGAVHDLLSEHRQHGEWFRPTQFVLAFARSPDMDAIASQLRSLFEFAMIA